MLLATIRPTTCLRGTGNGCTVSTPAHEPSDHRPDRRALELAVIIGAALLQLLVLVPFTVASGLLAPLWAVVTLYLLWLAAAAVLVRLASRRPLLTPAVPIVNAALLWLALTAGDVLLGWTA
jgi:hypothetical protein